uniref:BZIP domain-containing protein n=1 Tax=Anopheles atroparvus TaxID=41427 RepID=A0AAG5CZV8_ANOAO
MDSDINNFLFNQDDWPGEDFMDTLLKIDDTMLFSGPATDSTGGTDELDEFMIRLSKSYASETCLGEQPAMSPLSSHSSSDQDFHGFPSANGSSSGGASLDGYLDDDFTGGGSLSDDPAAFKPLMMNVDYTMLNGNDPNEQALSSAASDSGLSSDHLDLDQNTEYEALSPALSSPGPSISERGGQNSPPRYVKSIEMQPTAAQLQQMPTLAPAPTVQLMGGQQTMTTTAGTVQRTTTVVPPIMPQQKSLIKTQLVSSGVTAMHKPAAKLTTGTTATAVYQPIIGGTGNGPKRLLTTSGAGTPQQLVGSNGKELKIIRMATMKNGQTVAVANGLTSAGSAHKKVTLQLKNASGTVATTGGAVMPKNVVLTSAPSGTGGGVRKIIRMQQQTQQNGRQILVPVTIQDLRTIKIVNTSNLKSKSANIKLAAANLLQQSKQGLIQKNVVLSKDQLLTDDGLSDAAPSSSDSESYVFEDIMQQSNSVIAEVERQQKQQQQHIISDSDVEPDGDDDGDDDDDVDMDDIGKGRNRNGTYQKLVLTAEEKRLLAKEGITLPTSYPLTKHEERELKRIRRKIRNKISAQDSRKRKKEYVDGLEERVKQCTEENQNLVKRIKILQSQNHDLVSQMKRIQSLLTKGTSKTTQPATCLMVLLISMALVAVPNLKLGNTPAQQNIQDSIEMAELRQEPANDKLQATSQSRRSLLFDTKEHAASEEEVNFDEIMSSFNANSLIANEHDYFTEADGAGLGARGYEPPQAKRPRVATTLIDYDVDDDVWNGGRKIRIKQETGSMSPDSSSSSNDLFEQKVREFQATLQKSVRDMEQEFKSVEALGLADSANSELIVDRDLLDLVAKKDNGLYELNLDTFSSLQAKGGIDGGATGIDLLGVVPQAPTVAVADTTGSGDAGAKLNASQQIQQQNNKRKLLL